VNAAPDPQENLLLARAYELTQQGVTPYTQDFARSCTLVEMNENFDEVEDADRVVLDAPIQVCGRVSWLKDHGDHILIRIEDQNTHLQVRVYLERLPESQSRLLQSRVYRGDYLGFHVQAVCRIDGYITAEANEWCYLSLANLPIPLHLDTQRQRRERYLHLASSLDAREQMVKRSQVLHQIRRVLNSFDILEVNTPYPLDGIAETVEYYQLQHYLVGGLEQVYEIGPVRLSHAIDWLNHPQALWLRACLALKSVNYTMQLMEHLLLHVTSYLHAHPVILNTPFEYMKGGDRTGIEAVFPDDHLQQIDLSPGWAQRRLPELVSTIVGIDFTMLTNLDEALNVATQAGLQLTERSHYQSIEAVMLDTFRQLVQPVLIQPTFVIYPFRGAVSSFELIIKGMHMGCGQILNIDPAHMANDIALQSEYKRRALMLGMLPGVELALNIDRLCMLLLNIDDIRDIVPFPLPVA